MFFGLYPTRRFEKRVARSITNEPVRIFWLKEIPAILFPLHGGQHRPIQNKVGAFLADPTLARILTKPQEDLHIRAIMDRGGVLIVNLAKGG